MPLTTVILSLHPEWWPKMLSGEKLWEIRVTAPHPVYLPARVIVYLTKPVSAVVGEFICGKIEKTKDYHDLADGSCLTVQQAKDYMGARNRTPCKWEVSNPTEYAHSRKISDYGLKKPPQSWCYGKGGAV